MKKNIITTISILSMMIPMFALAIPPRITGTVTAAGITSATTWSVATTIPSVTNGCALIFVSLNGSNENLNDVSVAGASTTLIKDFDGNAGGHQVWYLANPTAGATNIIGHTLTVARAGDIHQVTAQNCNQSSASVLDIDGATFTNSGTSLTKAVTTTQNDVLIFSNLFGQGDPDPSPINVGGGDANQSKLASTQSASPQYWLSSSWVVATTTGSITTGWSWTGALAYDIFVFGIRAPSAATTPVVQQKNLMFDF